MSGKAKVRSHGSRDGAARAADELLVATAVVGPPGWPQHEATRGLLERLLRLQPEPRAAAPRTAALPAFRTWLQDNGLQLDGLDISEFPGYGLGLKATKPYAKGSNIINIPRQLIMTEDAAKKSSLGTFIEKDVILKSMPNIALVMYLLLEKFTRDSFWKPYIDILPTSYNTILYFSMEDLLELKGSPNFQAALKFYNDISRQYAYFYKRLQTSKEPAAKIMKNVFTFKEYCWAVSTVMTRLNIVPSESQEDSHTTALIPLWDMCNHTDGEITTHFNIELNQAEFFSLKDYNVGDQILIFYGIRTNAFFFLYNGFVYPDNKHDALTISLGISASDPLEQLKKQVLEKININSNTSFKIVSKNPPLSEELLAFARVFVMDKENLLYWLEENTEKLMTFENVSIKPDIEKKAYSFINVRCNLLLNIYMKDIANNKLESMKLSEIDDTPHPNRNEEHRLLIRQLKETEMKLLEKAIEFTQLKL